MTDDVSINATFHKARYQSSSETEFTPSLSLEAAQRELVVG
jgi:hypothetical protein